MTRLQYEHDDEVVSLVSARPEDQLTDWTKILYLYTHNVQFQSILTDAFIHSL